MSFLEFLNEEPPPKPSPAKGKEKDASSSFPEVSEKEKVGLDKDPKKKLGKHTRAASFFRLST